MHIILFAALALVFPLAVYCLALAIVNARETPTLASGPWDFAGVLFAASGMLIFGGPFVLTALNARWRTAVVLGYLPTIPNGVWLILWALYFVGLVGGAAALLWARRNVSVVYNIQPTMLEAALEQAFERLHLEADRLANRFTLRRRSPATGESDATAFTTDVGNMKDSPRLGSERVVGSLEIGFFSLMNHATLDWRGTETQLRRDVEVELARALTAQPSPESPVGGWFLTTATGLFGGLFLAFLVFLVSQWGRR